MYKNLALTIEQNILTREIKADRKLLLDVLVEYMQSKLVSNQNIQLNFICTHNSRRSHLAQIWAQVASSYYDLSNIMCYSGGTEQTAVYPAVLVALKTQGLEMMPLSFGDNPVYGIRYSPQEAPLVAFSKSYDHPFNPQANFAAVMTCSQAQSDCPFIPGAELRVSLPFEDPKVSDGTPRQAQVYEERSLEIASQLFYVFSKLKTDN